MDIEDFCSPIKTKPDDKTISDDKIISDKKTFNGLKLEKLRKIVKQIVDEYDTKCITNREEMKKAIEKIGRKHKYIPSMYDVLAVYRLMISTEELIYNIQIDKLLVTKTGRSLSGVVVITVWTSPAPSYTDPKTGSTITQTFSCKFNCKYCPNEPEQARSYLFKEPGVTRANANNYVSTAQFWDRAGTLYKMGHPVDKIELIVSGGTFNSYPKPYLTEFFRDQFYAANVAHDKINDRSIRLPLSLEEEQDINQNDSSVKIIGITIETRPDCINKAELEYLRSLGVTRVQIGVQHINNEVLRYIDRKCSNHKTIKAIKFLKDAGFKVDIHLMPDLPAPIDIGMSSLDMIQEDEKMFETVIEHPDYQADQWKIYPCTTVPWTVIEEWYRNGTYKPYAEMINPDGSNPLFELLVKVKTRIKPWVRTNRIIRDIPNTYIIGGNNNISMNNDILAELTKRKLKCSCIRCREIRGKEVEPANFEIKVRKYNASDGIEYFISWEDKDDLLLGFLRLRINSDSANKIFPELTGCAMIRELHIYGQVINHNLDNKGEGVQHIGLGKKLIAKAIEITKIHDLDKISVISGTGVRNYYCKQGFQPVKTYIDSDGKVIIAKGNYLIRNLLDDVVKTKYDIKIVNYLIAFIIVLFAILVYWYNIN